VGVGVGVRSREMRFDIEGQRSGGQDFLVIYHHSVQMTSDIYSLS